MSSKLEYSAVAATNLPSIVEGIVSTNGSAAHVHDNNSVSSSNHSSPISRRNSHFTFSWSSANTFSTLLTQRDDEEQEPEITTEDDTVVGDELVARYVNSYPEIVQEMENMLSESRSFTTTATIDRINDRNSSMIEERLSEIICRLASLGKLHTLEQLLANSKWQPYLNLDRSDDINGSANTPLIYASCFGKVEVVRLLLELGAKVDIQDNSGWTPLMWATVNGHTEVVKILLEHSASFEKKSASGRTIFDLVDVGDKTMISVLNKNTTEKSDCATTLKHRKCSLLKPASSTCQDIDVSDQDMCDTDTSVENEDSRAETLEQLKTSLVSLTSVHKFQWDRCLPDQMFVFAEQDIEHMLNVAISNETTVLISKAELYVPVNIIFLAARYANHYTGKELLQQLLSEALKRVEKVVKMNIDDIHILSFWIANLFQLLYYLKKDVDLVIATADTQLTISELISETYTVLITDSKSRFDRILESAILEYEPIEGLEPVDFADDWHRFFRRGRFSSSSASSANTTTKSDNLGNSSPTSPATHQQLPRRATLSPETVTNLLSSTLCVFSSYDVHPDITFQAIAQLFHFISCEIFNKILSNKKYLNRSKALQIRMNLTVLEEWIREQNLPQTLNTHLEPVIQLVQLLQCLTQVVDLMSYINTVKAFHLLNAVQLKKLVLSYRYEVKEPRLPEEVEKYAMQIAEDTVRNSRLQKQSQVSQSDYNIKHSMESIKSATNSILATNFSETQGKTMGGSRPSSVASFTSIFHCKPLQRKRSTTSTVHPDSISSSLTLNRRSSIQSSESLYNHCNKNVDSSMIDYDTMSIQSRTSTVEDVIFEEPPSKEMLVERRDSNLMLPFSLPKTTDMFRATTKNRRSSTLTQLSVIEKGAHDNYKKEQNVECLSDTIYSALKDRLLAEREIISQEESIVPFIPDRWLKLLDHQLY